MKAIRCEMCFSTDMVKQDGFFVCQSCGTKYAPDEARKLMVEIDKSGELENTIKCIYTFLDARNFKDAKEYCKKALEIDPENAEAFFCMALCGKGINSKKEFLEYKRHDIFRDAFYIKAKNNAKDELAKLIQEKEEQYYIEDGIYYSKDKTKLIRVSNTEIESVKINPEVKEISMYAFSSCNKLTEIEIPEGVEEIKDNAFWGCSSLAKVIIPNSVKKIGVGAFGSCRIEELTTPFIGENADGIGKTYIGDFLSPYNLKKVKVTGKSSIGARAFEFCFGLETVELCNEIERIGYEAFRCCRNLRKVVMSNSLKNIEGRAFYECEALKEIELPDSINEIGEEAFKDCKNLEKIKLPNGLRCIPKLMFIGCTNLKDIKIPNSVKNIGLGAFYGCEKLKK